MAVLASLAAACGAGDTSPTSDYEMKTSFGLTQNGFTQNGFTQNGFTQNGFTQNGFTQNGLTQNGFTQNGFTQNGFTQNGFTQNGFTQNGFTQNGFTQNGLSTFDMLKTDENARSLLQYIYSCAMPSTKTVTLALFPGEPARNLVLTGALNLAPEWETGACNETCQRWVSACVLARTNAFGAHVSLSIRGNHPALALSSDGVEETTYTLREGTYFGNIFASAPGVDPVTQATNGTLVNAPKLYACAGPDSDLAYLTLRFCSSNSDECIIDSNAACTETSGTVAPACSNAELSPLGYPEPFDCRAPVASDTHVYNEAITVYLKTPVPGETYAVCGNTVCEVDGQESAATCPSDCKTTNWANQIPLFGGTAGHSFTGSFNESAEVGTDDRNVAVSPFNDSVVLGGYSNSTLFGTQSFNANAVPIDVIPGLPPIGSGGYLARYDKTGYRIWGQRFTPAITAVAADASGSFAFAGNQYGPTVIVGTSAVPTQSSNAYSLIAKLDADGAALWAVGLGATQSSRALAFDATGNIIVAGTFSGTTSAFSVGAPWTSAGLNDIYVAKLNGSTGALIWAKQLGGVSDDMVVHLALDASGNALVTTSTDKVVTVAFNTPADCVYSVPYTVPCSYNYYYGFERGLYKLAAASGATAWEKQSVAMGSEFKGTGASIRFHSSGADKDGNVYLTGTFTGTVNFGGTAGSKTSGLASSGAGSLFIVKYDIDGNAVWAKETPGGLTPTEMRIVRVAGTDVVVIGGRSFNVDLGAGLFKSNTADLFLAAYTGNAGAFLWAKQYAHFGVGTANGPNSGVSGFFGGVDVTATVDTAGNPTLVTGGLFDGFMFADSNLVVNWNPTGFYQGDVFLNAFTLPCSTVGCDGIAPVLGNVPQSISVQATGNSSQAVYYTIPTAIDDRADGVTVSCLPTSGSLFPAGNSTVTCKATDAHGNFSTASFTVSVTDKTPPTLINMPAGITAISSVPVAIDYTLPTALDQVSGVRPVTCTPAANTVFNVTTTQVTCSASDVAGNTVTAKFNVTVAPINPVSTPTPTPNAIPTATPAPDTTAPVVTVPNTIVTAATGANGAVVIYSGVSAQDNKDGVVGTTCSKNSGTLFGLGTTTVVCSATDAAGNVGTKAFDVKVTLSWTGFKQPINTDGSSIFKKGRTVPVKFALTGVPAGTNPVAHLSLAKISSGVMGTVEEATSTWGADSGNTFRYQDGEYHYNLATLSLSPGTYVLQVDLHDGVSRSVLISIRL